MKGYKATCATVHRLVESLTTSRKWNTRMYKFTIKVLVLVYTGMCARSTGHCDVLLISRLKRSYAGQRKLAIRMIQ